MIRISSPFLGVSLCSALVLAACVVTPQLREAGVAGTPLELSRTAFFPDTRLQGAPAALATLLYTNGLEVGPEAVSPLLPKDAGQRPVQSNLIEATRRLGRVPTVLAPNYVALDAELRAGRPVMVLLALAPDYGEPAVWQYGVVVGIDPDNDRLTLRLGGAGRRAFGYAAFERAWATGQHWAMVVSRPDELPATAEAEDWIANADAMVAAKMPEAAETMLDVATQQWGESALGFVAKGNVRYARRDLEGAGRAYRKAIELDANNAVAHNNLAEVLLDRHCADAAEDEIELALKLTTDPKLRERFEGTQTMVKRHAGPSVFCPALAEGAPVPTRYEGTPVDLNAMPESRAPRPRKPKKPPKTP